MSGRLPLEVGTRGTIGSLLKREIEYFRKVEPEPSERTRVEETASASSRRGSWPSFRFSISSWRKKKRRNSGIRPGICSAVEVADTGRLDEIPGFGYLNLRADSERFHV